MAIGYLELGFCAREESVHAFAAPSRAGGLAAQFTAVIVPMGVINKQRALPGQMEGHIIDRPKLLAGQFRAVVENYTAVAAAQFLAIRARALAAQMRAAIYDTTKLRVLWEFPSRGTSGTSWTASSTEPGDFAADNLNTDVVEQYWRSATGDKVVSLSCDTGLPQGVFLDTFAMLNHNLTNDAEVIIEGDDDPAFGSPGFVKTILPVTTENLFYIAEEFPRTSFRYWRVSLSDTTNPEAFLRVGTIVFGSASMLVDEQFSNPIRFGKRHYKDSVETEGFTTVSNDRGIKKYLGLTFQNLKISGVNYELLQQIFEEMRTSHKALWIPTPQYPARYAVFGKLTEIPEETHNDVGEGADYVEMTLEIDEAK